MNSLENRIPPPLVGLVVAVLMWLFARWLPLSGLPRAVTVLAAIILLVAGLVFAIMGASIFRRVGTTINPVHIENASKLVTQGIFSISRNPMYVGMTLALSAWAFYLDSLWTLVGPIVFVAFINRFQIIPEERMLTTIFGDSYREYCSRVRRWL